MSNVIESESYLFEQVINKSNFSEYEKNLFTKELKRVDSIKSINNQSEYHQLWWKFRTELLIKSRDVEINNYRSPEQTNNNMNFIKERIGNDFVYERSLKCTDIEKKYTKKIDGHKDWINETLIMNSGMSCISNCFTILISSILKKNSKIKVLMMPGYFETTELLSLYRKEIELVICETLENFYKVIREGDYDLVFIEPVTFSIDMNTVDIQELLSAILSGIKKNKMRFFIFDNTLINNINFPIKLIQEVLSHIPNVIVYCIQSLLKLNQVGLEFANGGVMQISCNKNYLEDTEYYKLIEKSKSIRDIFGQTPNSNQLSLLSNEFIFDEGITQLYTDRIFMNNHKVARYLYDKSDFNKVTHPSLNSKNFSSINAAPFIILELKDSSLKNYLKFTTLIKKENQYYKLGCNYGTSFGFQNTRYDVIEYDRHSGKSFLRLSIGAFDENNIDEIAELFSKTTKH